MSNAELIAILIGSGNVDETDIGRLHAGMPVVLTIGAMQGTVLQATLEYISPKAADVNGIIMFEVKAAAKIPESVFVRAGYSANASIVTDSAKVFSHCPKAPSSSKRASPASISSPVLRRAPNKPSRNGT